MSFIHILQNLKEKQNKMSIIYNNIFKFDYFYFDLFPNHIKHLRKRRSRYLLLLICISKTVDNFYTKLISQADWDMSAAERMVQ